MPEIPNLRIPDEYLPSVAAIARLSESNRGSLLKLLSGGGQTLKRQDLIRSIQAEVSDWSEASSRQFIDLLLSLRSVGRALKITSQSVARSVVDSRGLSLDEIEQKAFVEYFPKLLDAPNIVLAERGLDLQTEHEKNFSEARVITDIRPAFKTGTDDALDGAVITHSLRIRYVGTERQSLDIALDRQDLEVLRVTIDRALRKADYLESILLGAGITYIEPEDVMAERKEL